MTQKKKVRTDPLLIVFDPEIVRCSEPVKVQKTDKYVKLGLGLISYIFS